jgi:pimeloyl-ACP methyl ester carboxylesterase
MIRWQPIPVCMAFVLGLTQMNACVAHRVRNPQPAQYLQTVLDDDQIGVRADVGVIEFDDHGVLWNRDQLEDTIDRIRAANAESERGTLVLVYIHGWKHNADPERRDGALARFRANIERTAREQPGADGLGVDRVVGVFLGWHGDSSDIPFQEQTTFWNRRAAAERVASIHMRETMLRIMQAAKERPGSKCFVVGHSMGGLIVGKTFAPSLATMLLVSGPSGTHLPVDLILLQNPALDALASWQFIDFLKRSRARVELRQPDGTVLPAHGPIMASITSEADTATGRAYPFGRTVTNLFTPFRRDTPDGQPSQRHLATRAEGHVDYLISHRARVEDGAVVLERVPDAFNDTPFWVIQASPEISRDHNDVNNPLYGQLIQQLIDLNQVYRPDLQTWLVPAPD